MSETVTVTGCTPYDTDLPTVSDLDAHSEYMEHSPSAHEAQTRSELDVPSDQHIAWLMKAQTDNIIVIDKNTR